MGFTVCLAAFRYNHVINNNVWCCWLGCRLGMNANRNQSKVAWDCYFRSCPDDPSNPPSAPVSSSPASVADAKEKQPRASEGVQQIVPYAVCV